MSQQAKRSPRERDDVVASRQATAAMCRRPEGAQTYQDGKYYKLARGRLWCHDGFEWVLSTRSPGEITGVHA